MRICRMDCKAVEWVKYDAMWWLGFAIRENEDDLIESTRARLREISDQ